MPIQSEKLPQKALQSVAAHGVAHFFGNSTPHTPRAIRPWAHKQHKVTCKETAACIITQRKIRPPLNSACSRQRVRREFLHYAKSARLWQKPAGPAIRRLRGKPLAALGATTAQNIPSTHAAHARTEAMSALSSDLARLIRSFHHSLLQKIGTEFVTLFPDDSQATVRTRLSMGARTKTG